MTIKLTDSVAEYSCRKKPTTPEERKEIQKRIDDPYTLTGIDKLRAFYEWQGLEFDENLFDNIVKEHSLDE